MMQFEFHAFKGEDDGHVDTAEITHRQFKSDSAAKAAAGRLAKRIKGPVDIAFAGAALWNDRYITTASPSIYHSAGYRFARVE